MQEGHVFLAKGPKVASVAEWNERGHQCMPLTVLYVTCMLSRVMCSPPDLQVEVFIALPVSRDPLGGRMTLHRDHISYTLYIR